MKKLFSQPPAFFLLFFFSFPQPGLKLKLQRGLATQNAIFLFG